MVRWFRGTASHDRLSSRVSPPEMRLAEPEGLFRSRRASRG